MDRAIPPAPNEGTPRDATNPADEDRKERVPRGDHADEEGNPPHTTKGPITSPKFGSAGSGGAEYEGPLKKN